MSPNHPQLALLFFVTEGQGGDTKEEFQVLVGRLAASREWVIEPPEFVYQIEEPDDPNGGDLPIETIGGCLKIYSTFAPWSLPKEVDERHLAEVKWLIGRLREFSESHSWSIEFELEGDPVGRITSGRLSKNLAEGFLGEWERSRAQAGM